MSGRGASTGLAGSPASLTSPHCLLARGACATFGMGQPLLPRCSEVLRGARVGVASSGTWCSGCGAAAAGEAAAQLPVPEHLRQELALSLRQKHDAEDAEECTDARTEPRAVGLAHVEALGWSPQPRRRPQRHDEAQASAPGRDDKALSPRLWASPHPSPAAAHPASLRPCPQTGGLEAALAARLLSRLW